MLVSLLSRPLKAFLLTNKPLMRKYEKITTLEEGNTFWSNELLNSENYSFSTKLSLVKNSLFWLNHPTMHSFPDAVWSWAYANSSGTLLNDLCRKIPLDSSMYREALSNRNWELKNFLYILRSLMHPGDSYRFAELKAIAITFFRNLPTDILSKEIIVELLKFIHSPDENEYFELSEIDFQNDKEVWLSDLGLALKSIVVERVGGELPYEWAVRM